MSPKPKTDLTSPLADLEATLCSENQWNCELLDSMRRKTIEPVEMKHFLMEYHWYVSRFPNWLALILANTDNENVMRCLLPNLVDEVTDGHEKVSHKELLARLLRAIGVDDSTTAGFQPCDATKQANAFFSTLFSEPNTLKSLFAIGPATEAISHCFLGPMECSVRHCFDLSDQALTYFRAHDPEAEEEHKNDIYSAIGHVFDSFHASEHDRLWAAGIGAASEAIEAHQQLFSIHVGH